MMVKSAITDLSLEDFQSALKDKQVVLLYPWANYRNLFFSYFLETYEDRVIYHRLMGTYETLADWVTELLDSLSDVQDGFGGALRDALSGADAASIGRALAEDVGQIFKDDMVFFLDELDRAPLDDDFRTFAAHLVDALPGHVKLVVNSRQMTYQPWVQMVDDGRALVLGTDFRDDNLMFSTEQMPKPQVEVYAFGRGHALVNGSEIENWDGALPRNLFFYFVDNEMVTRDNIFEVFWPKLTVKEATNVFHVTKRKITERISVNVAEEGNYELTQYSSGFYVPSDKVVRHYDVRDFETAFAEAKETEDTAQRAAAFERAIKIYRAPFLQTIDMPWVEERRDRLAQMYIDALIGLGRIHKDAGEYELALGYFVRTLRESPQREDIYREVMTMYWKLDRHDDALAQYYLLETHLDTTVGVPPSRKTRQLRDQIAAEYDTV